ncbi:MAG: hypothetical protein F6J97_07220 [Leptolyngbya sp. SIO4C1]|nr:hypothetical protein [Leptolyngbya sp. SIO4C1]
MLKQMSWQSTKASDGHKILHLRFSSQQPWQPYTAFSELSVPDYPIEQGSLGFATFQKLLKEGWKLMPSVEK